MALKRLMKELEEIRGDPPPNCSAEPINNDFFLWEGKIEGPPDSPYEGGLFIVKINFPVEYPFKPPHIKFDTKIYHPNISADGYICLDTLKSQWSCAFTIGKVLQSLQLLLSDPNAEDPLVPEVARIFKSNRKRFNKIAKEWTLKYAKHEENAQNDTNNDSNDDSSGQSNTVF